jgi:hypothetical protein
MRWIVHSACIGEGRNAYKVSVEKPERMRSLENPRRRLEDNVRMEGCGLDLCRSESGPVSDT